MTKAFNKSQAAIKEITCNTIIIIIAIVNYYNNHEWKTDAEMKSQ